MAGGEPNWREHGIRIVRSGELDTNTAQTPGMTRAAAITHASAGAKKLWAGTVVVQPNVKTGAHHHGELETVLYIVKGRARFRWGNHLEFVDEAGPGDFIYVPPFVPHQEINARMFWFSVKMRGSVSPKGRKIPPFGRGFSRHEDLSVRCVSFGLSGRR